MSAGDTLVMATDGLFDNLFDADIGEILAATKGQSTKDAASAVAHAARSRSFDQVCFDVGPSCFFYASLC